MRRLATALVPVMASVASLSLVACGNDGSTSEAGAAVDAVSVPVDVAPLLIDALPDISGPTVLWFWAPG